MYGIREAAAKVGLSEGLLILWIETKRIVPSVNLSTAHLDFDKYPAALKHFVGEGKELHGWNRFVFTAEDVERLRSLVESTAKQRTKAETAHVKGTHYTVQELSSLWSFGVDKIRELFEDEPDVIKIQSPRKKGRRQYVTLRIPEKVAERVQRRLS